MSSPETFRILIVDDEEPQMRALCDTLRDQGYETEGYITGEAALDALRKGNSFDLLLSDLMMPGMDGIALLKAVLQISPDIVGIIMTGHGTIDTAVEAMKSGALDYILKPFKLSAILPVLNRALAVRKLRIENAELARSVRERTLELEGANKELEAFSFSVSHDLRAPLRAINGFSKIIVERYAPDMPPEAGRFLENVMNNARQMEQLIEDLLNFSRLNRVSLTKDTVNTGALIDEVLQILHGEMEGRKIQFVRPPLPACHGDRALLKQVFSNLISNAIKFTRKQPSPVIEIGVNGTQPDMVYFIRDNGAGFEMEYAKNLFGVFQRLHSTSEFEGTGVGLSIVQRIIHRHGGRIWAHGEKNKGATFSFMLPAAPASPVSK